jgi:hypothetical protein
MAIERAKVDAALAAVPEMGRAYPRKHATFNKS